MPERLTDGYNERRMPCWRMGCTRCGWFR